MSCGPRAIHQASVADQYAVILRERGGGREEYQSGEGFHLPEIVCERLQYATRLGARFAFAGVVVAAHCAPGDGGL